MENMTCRNCRRTFAREIGYDPHNNNCCDSVCMGIMGIIPVKVFPTVSHKAPAYEQKFRLRKNREAKRNTKRRQKSKKKLYHQEFFRSNEWKEIRFRVLEKYGRECMCCGETKGAMNVDHIKPKSIYPELSLNFDNLQVLCKACNEGKGVTSQTDFRGNHNHLTPTTPTVSVVVRGEN